MQSPRFKDGDTVKVAKYTNGLYSGLVGRVMGTSTVNTEARYYVRLPGVTNLVFLAESQLLAVPSLIVGDTVVVRPGVPYHAGKVGILYANALLRDGVKRHLVTLTDGGNHYFAMSELEGYIHPTAQPEPEEQVKTPKFKAGDTVTVVKYVNALYAGLTGAVIAVYEADDRNEVARYHVRLPGVPLLVYVNESQLAAVLVRDFAVGDRVVVDDTPWAAGLQGTVAGAATMGCYPVKCPNSSELRYFRKVDLRLLREAESPVSESPVSEVTTPAPDPVNHPSHYKQGGLETIDAIESWGLGFCLGNAVKYISRAGKKDASKTTEDLLKARWYIDRELARLQKEVTT